VVIVLCKTIQLPNRWYRGHVNSERDVQIVEFRHGQSRLQHL